MRTPAPEDRKGLPKQSRNASSSNGPVQMERASQLVAIAYDHIAARGFEGLRFQDVAKEAGINNATLYYYFPSKEALIQGVTKFLMERLKTPIDPLKEHPGNAIEELRQMFEDSRRRLITDPSFFIVITELALRARRDAAIDRIGQQRDNFWQERIVSLLERGIVEGQFRNNINVDTAALALIAQLKGIAHHGAMRKRRPGEIDSIVSEISKQVEHWLTCNSSVKTVDRRVGTKKQARVRSAAEDSRSSLLRRENSKAEKPSSE